MTEHAENAARMTESELEVQDEAIGEALRQAVREALVRHARLGEDVVIWRDGRAAVVPAQEALRLADEETGRKA